MSGHQAQTVPVYGVYVDILSGECWSCGRVLYFKHSASFSRSFLMYMTLGVIIYVYPSLIYMSLGLLYV